MRYNPFEIVKIFEEEMADYAGSKYAVALDTCTSGLFLCCKYLTVSTVTLPKRTYLSVASAIKSAGGNVEFEDIPWNGEYYLKPYPIIDGALRMCRNMHIPNTFRCLSFQYRKHLPIGRGGMILTDDEGAWKWFKLARFHGRHEKPLAEDEPEFMGWNCFMEPERAARGLTLMMTLEDFNKDLQIEYPDISQYELHKNMDHRPG